MSPRTSVRASARERYLAMVGRGEALALAPEEGKGAVRKVDVARAENLEMIAVTPLPSPPPQGGREQTEQGERHQPDLMARVRAMYETSAVPVREIARLCGVTERTLYKYVARGGWKRRYLVKPRGVAAAAANRGRHWKRAKGHAPAKGSGGRFIAGAERGQGVPRGIKALDLRARAEANAACAAAAALEAEARATTEFYRWLEVRMRALQQVVKTMEAQDKFQKERKARRAGFQSPQAVAADDTMERMLAERARSDIHLVESLDRQRPRTGFAAGGVVTAPPMRE